MSLMETFLMQSFWDELDPIDFQLKYLQKHISENKTVVDEMIDKNIQHRASVIKKKPPKCASNSKSGGQAKNQEIKSHYV